MIRKRTNERSLKRERPSDLWLKCTNLRSLKQVHASLVVRGFNSDPWSLRELIFSVSMVVVDAIDYAYQLFGEIAEPDTFMWNTVMRGSLQSRRPLRAVLFYNQMENRGGKSDNYTFPFLLKACSMLGWTRAGCCAHGKVVRNGFENDMHIRNSLVYFHANCGDLNIAQHIFDLSVNKSAVSWSALTAGYAKRGKVDVARKIFDEMPVKDLVSWNVMITGYVKKGEMENARTLFDVVPKRDVVTWNTMISGYVLSGQNCKAIEMFEDLIRSGEQPDEVTLLNLLSACTELGDVEFGRKLHSMLLEMGRGFLSTVSQNALINMYAKTGNIEIALEVFDGMKQKHVSTMNSLIVGLAFHGHYQQAINAFEELLKLKNVEPDEISFVGVLVACSHFGRVQEGRSYFELMTNVYKILPNAKHYGCMIDLLGRVGLLDEAFEVIQNMKVEPNGVIWRTLLGACNIHGNVELARYASDRLKMLRRDQSGDYVLLSNVYASVGQWSGAENVRVLMDNNGVRKEAGGSTN